MKAPLLHFRTSDSRGFTLIEVMISALLICVGLAGIMSMNSRSLHTLRATRQTAAASQILQQRVESMRGQPWPQFASAAALARLMDYPADSARELLSDTGSRETITVSVVQPSDSGPQPGLRSFRVKREHRAVTIEVDDDLSAERTLFVNAELWWTDLGREHVRTFRTVICRAGLTRSGIFGSTIGRRLPPPPAISSALTSVQ